MNCTIFRKFAGVFILALLMAACASGPVDVPSTLPGEQLITVGGQVTMPKTWSAAQIQADFANEIKTIKYTSKDHPHTAMAVPLLTLINAAAPALEPKNKHDQLRLVVVIEAKDGYIATFALAELLPENGNREVWAAVTVDDKPLTDRDSPLTLIVPGDQKPERFVHGIKSIRIVDVGEGMAH